MKKGISLLIFTAVLGAAVHAQITISGGFAVSYMMDGKLAFPDRNAEYNAAGNIGVGGNLYIDYILPINIPLSLGIESGVDTATFRLEGFSGKDTMLAIPVLLRVGYHFDLARSLDLYLVGKGGVVFGTWNGDLADTLKNTGYEPSVFGVGFGFDIGIAYYFISFLGVFVEAGFDDYMLTHDLATSEPGYPSGKIDAPFYRFVTAGLSLKF